MPKSEPTTLYPDPVPWPDVFPDVAEAFDGPCLLEVFEDWRGGRGRFWRPMHAGYTDSAGRAGVYSADHARGIARGSERCHAVSAEAVYEALLAQIATLKARISEMKA